MNVYFEVKKIGNIDDYINLPITNGNEVIGVVNGITELENTYLLNGYIRSYIYDLEIDFNKICSMEIIEK